MVITAAGVVGVPVMEAMVVPEEEPVPARPHSTSLVVPVGSAAAAAARMDRVAPSVAMVMTVGVEGER